MHPVTLMPAAPAAVASAPRCPVCRILEAVSGQHIDIAVDLLSLAGRVRCRCQVQQHPVLVAHPHTQAGCCGFMTERRNACTIPTA
jgi:hypothetical protein